MWLITKWEGYLIQMQNNADTLGNANMQGGLQEMGGELEEI